MLGWLVVHHARDAAEVVVDPPAGCGVAEDQRT
jgi:hypothetical protein